MSSAILENNFLPSDCFEIVLELFESWKPFRLSSQHFDSLSGDFIVFVSDLIDSASESVSWLKPIIMILEKFQCNNKY